MGVRPALSVPQVSPAEMELLIVRTGLVLNPGQVADLVLAWRQIVALTALIPRDRPMADDLPSAFRLPPPRTRPGAKRRASAKAGPRTKPGPRAKPGATKRPAAAKTARKSAPKRR